MNNSAITRFEELIDSGRYVRLPSQVLDVLAAQMMETTYDEYPDEFYRLSDDQCRELIKSGYKFGYHMAKLVALSTTVGDVLDAFDRKVRQI